MKQSLKYGLLMLFALLLHALATEATETECQTPDLSLQSCSVSQARPIRNAMAKIYHFYSALSCDLEHADLSHLSANKNFLRLTTRQLTFQGITPPVYEDSTHLYIHSPQDTVVHYIYGQRKIVI